MHKQNTTASSTNFKVYQLDSWAWHLPKKMKGGNNEQPISLSHRIIPFRPTVASHHHRGPHLALNPVAFITPSHPGAPRCDKAGILDRGAVSLNANLHWHTVLISFLSEHENRYLPWWWWWWNSNMFKKDCDSPWSTYPILSPKSFSLKSQVLKPKKLCMVILFKLDNLEVQLGNFCWKLEILETFNSNEIVAFYTSPEKFIQTLRKLPPFRCSRLTESPRRLRQIDGVPFTWKITAAEIDGAALENLLTSSGFGFDMNL